MYQKGGAPKLEAKLFCTKSQPQWGEESLLPMMPLSSHDPSVHAFYVYRLELRRNQGDVEGFRVLLISAIGEKVSRQRCFQELTGPNRMVSFFPPESSRLSV